MCQASDLDANLESTSAKMAALRVTHWRSHVALTAWGEPAGAMTARSGMSKVRTRRLPGTRPGTRRLHPLPSPIRNTCTAMEGGGGGGS